jgi:hypothetical protein
MSSQSPSAALKLYFPDSGGGPNVGPSDAGAEHFAGNLMAHLARECAQNAIDARKGDGPITLKFNLEQMKAKEIPEFKGGLNDAWDAASKWWGDKGRAYPNVFKPAAAVRSEDTVPVLIISDSNTKGLEGISDNNDESGGSWTNLVKSTGVANSSKGAGGAFGIGKMAPFACSALRTVFYQTRSKDGWGFQGVVRLMTHRDANTARKLQAFGMIGLKSKDPIEKCEISIPVTSREMVPAAFRDHRDKGTYGTDIFVVGFVAGDDWKLHVKAALITNFFPAILDGYAVFEVGGDKISKEKIIDDLSALKKEALGAGLDDLVRQLEHTYWYIKAREASVTGPKSWILDYGIETFGKVRIGIVQATKDQIKVHGQLPGRCFMCRSNRMRIFTKPYQLTFPFAAFMICDHKDGNEYLRRLEPPTHTAWEKDRDKSPRHEVFTELNKIYQWIRDEIAKLAPPVSDEALTLESVAKAIKGLNLKEEDVGKDDGNDADSLIKNGVKRSPFVRVSYHDDSIKLPIETKRGGTTIKKMKSVDADSSFFYRGDSRYVVRIKPDKAVTFKGEEILRLFAINFNGSPDEIAFKIVSPKPADLKSIKVGEFTPVTRSTDEKHSSVCIPAGHKGEIAFVIETEIALLSLSAQLLAPVVTGEDKPEKKAVKRKTRKSK